MTTLEKILQELEVFDTVDRTVSLDDVRYLDRRARNIRHDGKVDMIVLSGSLEGASILTRVKLIAEIEKGDSMSPEEIAFRVMHRHDPDYVYAGDADEGGGS